jgi:hypothetical protein
MDRSSRQYYISDLLSITAILAVALFLVPIAMRPAMGFLWIPIGLVLVYAAGLLLTGRQGAKRVVLGALTILVFAFAFFAALYALATVISIANAR